jgi:F-type H+-transporting ATPase subunit delta
MKDLILVKRYTQGLVGALDGEAEFAGVGRELADFQKMITTNSDLAGVLASPFVEAEKKVQIIRNILAASGFNDKTSRFLLLLFGHNRLCLLGHILQALPTLWNERQGVTTFEVSSVVTLSGIQKKKLQAELERLERRPVSLNFKIEPELVAGLSLKKGNIVYDASIRGHLAKLKAKICEG